MHTTFAEVKSTLASGSTVLDIVGDYLKVIHQNSDLNAFLEVFEDSAKAQAVIVDTKIANKTAGKLAGMVIGLKDNLCYKGHKVSAASKILEGFESLYTATAVQRLIDEDAVIIGRLNCDEFAMGSSNENSAFGPVKNKLNIKLCSWWILWWLSSCCFMRACALQRLEVIQVVRFANQHLLQEHMVLNQLMAELAVLD